MLSQLQSRSAAPVDRLAGTTHTTINSSRKAVSNVYEYEGTSAGEGKCTSRGVLTAVDDRLHRKQGQTS